MCARTGASMEDFSRAFMDEELFDAVDEEGHTLTTTTSEMGAPTRRVSVTNPRIREFTQLGEIAHKPAVKRRKVHGKLKRSASAPASRARAVKDIDDDRDDRDPNAWVPGPARRGETIMTQAQVRVAAGRLPFGLEYLGVNGPIGHVGRDGTLYSKTSAVASHQMTNVSTDNGLVAHIAAGGVGRAATVGMVDAHSMLDADDLDFGLTPNAVVAAGASSFSAPDLFSGGAGFVTTTPMATGLGSSQDMRRRYANVSAQQTKRAKAEERVKRIALKKRLFELENLTSTLAERVERVAEEREELSLIAHRANAKVQELDAKRKTSTVSRSISQLRQKIGAKPDMQHGFDALRYRSLLEIVHKQCLTSVRQLMSHQWGFPFTAPVDAEALGLPTYHDVIKNPMDLGTIKKFIEDGGKYLVSEDVDVDVRLTFANAMTFNKEGTDVHTMAKGLLAEWDTKWVAIQQRIVDVEACLLVEREVAIARNEAAARRADAAAKEVERSNTSAALDVALTQLAEVEAQMLAIMRPLSHDDREGLVTSLKRLPSGLREGAEQIIARNSGGGWDATRKRLENINDHSDLTLHLLVRYAKNMNRNRIAVIAGWCGHSHPEELLDKFKEEPPTDCVDDLATFVGVAPAQHHAGEHLGLRTIDAIDEEYDFDPLAFDDLLGDVPDDHMDFDPLAL